MVWTEPAVVQLILVLAGTTMLPTGTINPFVETVDVLSDDGNVVLCWDLSDEDRSINSGVFTRIGDIVAL